MSVIWLYPCHAVWKTNANKPKKSRWTDLCLLDLFIHYILYVIYKLYTFFIYIKCIFLSQILSPPKHEKVLLFQRKFCLRQWWGSSFIKMKLIHIRLEAQRKCISSDETKTGRGITISVTVQGDRWKADSRSLDRKSSFAVLLFVYKKNLFPWLCVSCNHQQGAQSHFRLVI